MYSDKTTGDLKSYTRHFSDTYFKHAKSAIDRIVTKFLYLNCSVIKRKWLRTQREGFEYQQKHFSLLFLQARYCSPHIFLSSVYQGSFPCRIAEDVEPYLYCLIRLSGFVFHSIFCQKIISSLRTKYFQKCSVTLV